MTTTEGTRRCHRCEHIKVLSRFYANPKDREHGRAWECKDCTKARSAVRQTSLREELRPEQQRYARESKRRSTARSLGLTPEQLDDLLTSQDGVCAICKRAESLTYRGRVREMALDHCHKTGRVRGLLCAACNQGLGKFDDDPDRLAAAVLYVLHADASAALRVHELLK